MRSLYTPWTALKDRGYSDLNGTAIQDNRGLIIAVTVGDVPELEPDRIAQILITAAEQHEALKHLLFDLEELIKHSSGVAGLHLNGDLAEWGDITEGGRFEEWLGPAMAAARAAILQATGA